MSAQEVYGSGTGPITASAAISCTEIQGVFCSNSTAGTLAVFDGTTASGRAVVATFTLIAGTFHRLPFKMLSGSVFLQIGGTTTITPAVS